MSDARITVEELRGTRGIRLLDIRKRPSDQQIPGSERCDGIELESGAYVPFTKEEAVVVYCGSGNSCTRIADQYAHQGYNIRALEGGFAAWTDQGGALEDRSY